MLRILVALTLLDGCIYSVQNVRHGKSGYEDYPTTIVGEHHRRSTRRKWALIGSPLEIATGIALGYIAVYANSGPSHATTVSGQVSDAGKEALARAFMLGAGLGLVGSGIGDGVLGAIDRAFSSPYVRNGKIVPESQIDTIDPPPGPRLAFHGTSVIGTQGVGADVGFGLAHWITPTIRLRHSASAEADLEWDRDHDRRLAISGETQVEYAYGREGAGLYPKTSLGLFAGGGWSMLQHGKDLPLMRGGLSFGLHSMSIRLGTSYSPGDRRPSFDVGTRIELRVD